MNNKLFNYKHILANRVSSYPFLFSQISRMLSGRDCYTTRATDIIIDGFPRSANTYATYAFITAQSKKYIVANHIHKKSQFIIGAKYNIPSILLIRKPLDCISSLLIRQPRYDPAVLFKSYHDLYFSLSKLNSYVVAKFEDVLDDYGAIINKVNLKFGSDFELYIKNTENEEKVKQIIQTQDELLNAHDYEQRVAYPTQSRNDHKNNVYSLLEQKKYEPLNKKCEEVYFELINKNQYFL